MDMRHRSTPVQTCQRYAVREDRVNSAATAEVQSRTGPGSSMTSDRGQTSQPPARVRRDTPLPGDNWARTCGRLVDPQARELLASQLPDSPTARRFAHTDWAFGGSPSSRRSGRTRLGQRTGSDECCLRDSTARAAREHVRESDRSSQMGHPSILHNLWTKVWSRGGTVASLQQAATENRERDRAWTQHRARDQSRQHRIRAGHPRQVNSRSSGQASSTTSLPTNGCG